MASTKALKQRIKSTKNTAQITKAMEVVSATKMRRAQEFAIRARPFAAASLDVMKGLLARTPTLPALLAPRPVRTAALVVVTSDKGLAGAFNANVLRRAEAWLEEARAAGRNSTVIPVGKKASEYFLRRNVPVHRSFSGFGDYTDLAETLPIAETVIEGFLLGTWDETDAVYTHFRTTLKQETVVRRVLPATRESVEEIVAGILPERGRFAGEARIANGESRYTYEYKFEPNAEEILNQLVPQLIRMHIHHLVLESNASEHSARMVAMKNATDSAKDLISELTLTFNNARQAGITKELTEITAGKEALEG